MMNRVLGHTLHEVPGVQAWRVSMMRLCLWWIYRFHLFHKMRFFASDFPIYGYGSKTNYYIKCIEQKFICQFFSVSIMTDDKDLFGFISEKCSNGFCGDDE